MLAEKAEAVALFLSAGQYHFAAGDNESAEKQYRTVIAIADDPATIAEARKLLANVLFLRGKKLF